jgi:hypothetical protein
MRIKKFNESLEDIALMENPDLRLNRIIMSLINHVLAELESDVSIKGRSGSGSVEEYFNNVKSSIQQICKKTGISREEMRLVISRYQDKLLPEMEKINKTNTIEKN